MLYTTEGTLEARIDKLIAEKRKFTDSLIKEDDAGMMKAFDRDELKELLSFGD